MPGRHGRAHTVTDTSKENVMASIAELFGKIGFTSGSLTALQHLFGTIGGSVDSFLGSAGR